MERKRDEFKTYLERTGVVDALTKAIVELYETDEKPADALSQFRAALQSDADTSPADLKAENEALKQQVEELKAEVASLKAELNK